MTTETYVTQTHAARLLPEFLEKVTGKSDHRNFQYLLNDQRRGRQPNPIPYEKVRGRILYRVADLKDWAETEAKRERPISSGIYEVEGATGLERLIKLSVAVGSTH